MTVMPFGAPPSELGTRVAAYLHNAGFAGNDLVIAVAIAKAESGWNFLASHANSDGTHDWGLMQINDIHKPTQVQKTNPIANAKLAHDIYSRAHGFTPWTTYNSGAYKGHLPEASQAVKDLQAKGSQWERDTIKLQPVGDSNGANPTTGETSSLNVDVSNPLSAVSSGFNALTSQFTKLGGNFIAIAVAITLLVLGIVILMRGNVTKAAGTVAGAAVKGVLP